MTTPGLVPSARFGRITDRSQAGAGIIEAMIGTVIATIGILALCVANADCLSITRAHKEVLVADQCLLQRIDQYRAANWQQITDSSSAATLLNQAPLAANYNVLQNQTETVTISAYPPVTPAIAPVVVTRDPTGLTTVLSQPPLTFNLRYATAVRIDFLETWTSVQGQRPRSLQMSTVVALGGLLH